MDEPLIINIADARAHSHPRRATQIEFEPDGAAWPDTGVNVQVLQPGQPNCLYHSEPVQEDFLVLHGECIAVVDGEEHRLREWDFVHCPAGTDRPTDDPAEAYRAWRREPWQPVPAPWPPA